MATLSGTYALYLLVVAAGLVVAPKKFEVLAYPYDRTFAIIFNLIFCLLYLFMLSAQLFYLRLVLKDLRYLRNVLLNPASDLPRV